MVVVLGFCIFKPGLCLHCSIVLAWIVENKVPESVVSPAVPITVISITESRVGHTPVAGTSQQLKSERNQETQ